MGLHPFIGVCSENGDHKHDHVLVIGFFRILAQPLGSSSE